MKIWGPTSLSDFLSDSQLKYTCLTFNLILKDVNRNIFTVVFGILVMFVKHVENVFFLNHRHFCLLKIGIVEKFCCFMNVDIIGSFYKNYDTNHNFIHFFSLQSIYLI